ncbi:MAG TPA: PqqD family protein [Thermoanaerobaculia bacterium]|nr:PqqD family protein [Thermoanaerobaculia bacterium]
MTPLDGRSVLKPASDVRFRIVDREAVVVRQRDSEVLVMSDVAARLLALADGVRPVDAWLDVLVEEYEVDRGTLERDVLQFAAELAEQGILEVADR